MKREVEIEDGVIPDGYEIDRWDFGFFGERWLVNDGVSDPWCSASRTYARHLIVRPIPKKKRALNSHEMRQLYVGRARLVSRDGVFVDVIGYSQHTGHLLAGEEWISSEGLRSDYTYEDGSLIEVDE